MDARLPNSNFPPQPTSNVFKILGKPILEKVNDENTLLCLDSPVSFVSSPKGIKRKWSSLEGSSLCLSLGHHSSSSSESKASSAATGCTAISSTDEESSMDLDLDFSLHLGPDKTNPKKPLTTKPKVDLQLSLSTGTCSEISDITYQPEKTSLFLNQVVKEIHPARSTVFQDFSTSLVTSVTCTSETINSNQYNRNSIKTCQFMGCGKGARGASGLCIAHGGGRRCQKDGCGKGAEGRTVYCKAHGGGRRCEYLGCTKSAEGRTDFCIAHGGGKRCGFLNGCLRAARGKSGLCIRHGGGKRCTHSNGCTKSAEGLSGLCISHGGGRRCQFPECGKGAQGSTLFCKAHGGGKRCTHEGCTKGAEGSTPFCKGHGGGKRCTLAGCPKSVHGGTLFCVAHGGGKRCAAPGGCTKSARGRTEFCVRHGGGKRCKNEGCGKSAQGSTDFCKAHGGGRKCSFLSGGDDMASCGAFSRGKTGLCASHGALVQDKRVHGGATIGATIGALVHDDHEKKTKEDENMNVDFYGEKQFSLPVGNEGGAFSSIPPARAPEGRVHGGSLMALLKSNLGGPSSEPVKLPHNWI